jgi:hypothetical protein
VILRICLESYCQQLSHEARCQSHRNRNKNLARDLLPLIAARDGWICQLCHKPVSKHRGTHPGAPSLHHKNGDISRNDPEDLALTHFGCNSAEH